MSTPDLPSAYNPHDAAATWSRAWADAKVFEADPSAPGEPFSIVIPPPNVTGSLHMGHALNNTLQDVMVRYKRMDGYNAVWVPGMDHAGIATQWVVRRQLEAQGIDYRSLGRDGFQEKIWAWKAESGGTIANQLRRLGVSCDWSREKFTLDADLQVAVTEHFVRLYEQGLIYRGERLINWDPADQTALSDLEVETEEGVEGELYLFAYPLADGSGEIVVATTRPETMLGDTAIAVHPDDARYQHLIGQHVRHPFVDRLVPIIADAILVDPAFGTGAVKITPAHDFNDFATGQRHDLPLINILEGDGRINAAGGQFAGLDRFEARVKVKEALDALGLQRGSEVNMMTLPRSQRSGAIVEPMLSTQWFVKMAPLAGPSVAAVENGFTRFVPKQWENTYFSWLREIKDWCISRQLWWGHRIPAWYAPDTGEVFVARTEAEAFAKAGRDDLVQDDDVLDTWFSSALWPFSVFGWPEKTPDLAKWYPTSVLVTGFDIIFFWVARMMFAGQHLVGQVPFRDVYIHAIVRDKHGDKMSKTKGNVVDPLTVIDAWGADAFRFTMVALAAQGRDVLWDDKRVENNHKFTTKIWQALRFCTLQADGWDHSVAPELGPYERWIQVRTGAAVARVRRAIDDYKFNDAATELQAFIWGEFCDWYLELSKTTIYDKEASEARKNGVRHTLFETMGVIVRLMHPIMPFLTEDIWARLPQTDGFVATAPYPRAADFPVDDGVLDEIGCIQEAVTEIRRIRGEMEISPRAPMTLLVPDASLLARLQEHDRAMRELASVTLAPLVERPVGLATAIVRGVACVLPLAGIVDFQAEVTRLDKAMVRTRKDIEQLERRLSVPGFTDRAPAEVVDDFRDKLVTARARLITLERSRAEIAEAL